MSARPALLAVSLVLASCRAPTEIKVIVQTNVPCTQVTATAFTSGELGAIESAPPTTESTSCSDMHLGTVVLVPSGDDGAQVGFKVVTALNGETIDKCGGPTAANDANCIVARRALRYLPYTPLTVIVDMDEACEGILCDPQSTCVNGACASATVDPGQCEGSGCSQNVLSPEPDAGVDGGDATMDATGHEGASPDAPDGGTPDATVSDAGAEDTGIAETSTPEAGPGVPGCDLGGLQAGSPWPMESYCPSGRNRSPLVGPAPTPVHKWTYVGGPIQSAPSIAADGTIYSTSYAGYAVALNPGDGGTIWTYSSPSGDASAFWTLPVIAADDTLRFLDQGQATYVVLGLDASVRNVLPIVYFGRGNLTIAGDGKQYFADNTSHLVAMNAADSVQWAVDGVSTDFDYPSVAHDGTVYSSTPTGGVFAVHPDGGVGWGVIVDGGFTTSSVVVAVDGTLRVGVTLSGSTGGFLYKMNASDGSIAWSQLVDPQGLNGNLAVADDGTTYVCGDDAMTAWTSSGQPAGSSPHACGQPTIDQNGDVYAICDGGQLTSFDASLNLRYQVPIPGFLGLVSDGVVIGPGNMAYVATNDNVAVGALDAFGPP
jgi:hypothetical protein